MFVRDPWQAGSWWLGFEGALAGGVVAIASVVGAGPWWLFALGLVVAVGAGVWAMRRVRRATRVPALVVAAEGIQVRGRHGLRTIPAGEIRAIERFAGRPRPYSLAHRPAARVWLADGSSVAVDGRIRDVEAACDAIGELIRQRDASNAGLVEAP